MRPNISSCPISLLVLTLVLGPIASAQQVQPGQSQSLERIRQVEAAEQQRQSVENAKWRTFPQDAPKSKALTQIGREQQRVEAASTWLMNPGTQTEECSYYWPDWKLIPGTSIRTTAMRCSRSLHTEVAVDCATMRMAVRDRYMANTRPGHWHGWGVPTATSSSDAGEQYAKQRMIAALCDNVVGAK